MWQRPTMKRGGQVDRQKIARLCSLQRRTSAASSLSRGHPTHRSVRVVPVPRVALDPDHSQVSAAVLVHKVPAVDAPPVRHVRSVIPARTACAHTDTNLA